MDSPHYFSIMYSPHYFSIMGSDHEELRRPSEGAGEAAVEETMEELEMYWMEQTAEIRKKFKKIR